MVVGMSSMLSLGLKLMVCQSIQVDTREIASELRIVVSVCSAVPRNSEEVT